jgi:gliding motility-associated-like protein
MLKIFTLFFLLSFGCYAQGEANIWYFGRNAGLDFNSGSPVVLTNGRVNTLEGCATISNTAGQLLFYTDGMKVWNKKHQIMSNGVGLLGNRSSSQAAVIVPKPNSTTIYYIFTTDDYEHANVNGVHYSEVDLSLNGGLGDVTSNKNILLLKPACEKLTAVKNANGDGYWVVFHGFGNNNFLAYSITASGVSTMPITSSVGTTIPLDNTYTLGYLKFSPDGSKLISCNRKSNAELFDFNTLTGSVTNPRILNNRLVNYGVEFSPSGNIAYISTWNNNIFQYDLTANNIASTETELWLGGNFISLLGALQLGPDEKIYIANYDRNFLCVINNPNIIGSGCDFQYNKIDLGSGVSLLGLPQFIQSYFSFGINFQNNCLGDNTSFSLNSSETITSASWNFGDGSTSNLINPIHTYATPGIYTVSVAAASISGSSTKNREIIISTVPSATQPQDLLICDDNNDGVHTFDLTAQNTVILNGQDSNLFNVSYLLNSVILNISNNYINQIPYKQEIIVAEVTNKANEACKSTTNFKIDVFDKPLSNLPVKIQDLTSCDNTSVGTDTDGRVVFDLTQKAVAILNGQSATQFLLSYYKDKGLTQPILTPTVYQNSNSTETIYVKMENNDCANCIATTSFKIEVFALPVITNVVDLKQCDDNIDGFSVFNLEEAINKITANSANETIIFFRTLTEAQNERNPITNVKNYTNGVVSNDLVYVKVTNSNGCSRISQLNLIVSTTQIPLTFSKTFIQCDDAILGTNTDDITSFDFDEVTQNIQDLFPSGQLLDITYYQNVADALAERNAIADISNYRNVSSPKSQNIYIRVDSKLNNDCLGLGGYITLNVEPIPIVESIAQKHCDDNQDGQYAFDTSTIQANLLDGLTNVTVSYFDQNNNTLSSPLPNPFLTGSQTLKVVVTNITSTACSFDTTLQFIVYDLPEAFPIAKSLTTICDDETDPTLQDGKFAFDTSGFQTTILGAQTGMTVNYFDANNNALSSPLPNPFVTTTQNIKVEVVNPINPTCSATTIIPFVVHPLPIIQLTGDELVCSDLPTFTKSINAGLIDENQRNSLAYSWTLDGVPILSETNYDWTVNKKGIYKVETTNSQGCSRTRTITVNASDKARVHVDIVDLSSENSITVLATGAGDYVFSLDNENGDYQTNNIFTNFPAGIHTVFVKDLNGCGIVPQEVAILGIPNYFTPNQDGYNDTWNLKGVNSVFNAKTTVRIFDRYGKLIKEISPMGDGWDGTYIGQQMPSTDYWYSIQLQDGRIFKGHFALKR